MPPCPPAWLRFPKRQRRLYGAGSRESEAGIIAAAAAFEERNGSSMDVVTGCVGAIGAIATLYLFYVLLQEGDER